MIFSFSFLQSCPSPFNPTQNYLHADNQLPADIHFDPFFPPLQENFFSNAGDGRSTAEIIANQSQDYVDEKLAEYQATIFQLQGIVLNVNLIHK